MSTRISVRPVKDGSVLCIDGKEFTFDNSAEVLAVIEKQLLNIEKNFPLVLNAISKSLD